MKVWEVKCIRDFPVGINDWISAGVVGKLENGSIVFHSKNANIPYITHLGNYQNRPHFFEVVEKRWIPKLGENYWFLSFGGTNQVHPMQFNRYCEDDSSYFKGNCYHSESEAQKVADRINAILAE